MLFIDYLDLQDGFFNHFIGLNMKCFSRKIPLAIIITISGDLSAIYSRCSYQSYSRMSFKQFQFPSPITFLNAVTDLIAFDPGVEVNFYLRK